MVRLDTGKPMTFRRPHTLRLKFVLYLGGILAVCLGGLFFWSYSQARQSILDQVDQQARTLLLQVVITRAWVADHGGLFVIKKPGVEENLLLPKSLIVDREGQSYLMRNPALVTREISSYAEEAGLYRFRLVSLKLKNPDNAPLDFEKEALELFQREGYEKTRDGVAMQRFDNNRPVYCRIVPLQVLSSCLECHQDQGYQLGEIRGGLSVIIPMDKALSAMAGTRNRFILSGLGIMGLVLGTVYLLLFKMVLQPVDHLHAVAAKLMAGEYAVTARLTTGDELESFARAFNTMTANIKEGYTGALKSLVAAMDARDSYTRGHTGRVAAYSVAIARRLGLSEEKIAEVEIGAILHDIGKIGISDCILHKPTPLDQEETNTMEAHVKAGAKIVNDADFLLCALPAILYHHERLDGKGYPEGLQGEELPLVARIISVADSFDAMTTDRPYRKGLSGPEALAEIAKHSGTQFDPQVVAAFTAVLSEVDGSGDFEQ
ncbi:MAG: HD domain-containing phosphohydrolase [Pseudomonadota bacterium]